MVLIKKKIIYDLGRLRLDCGKILANTADVDAIAIVLSFLFWM